MTALLSSELLKLRTTRTAFGFLVATVLLTVGIGAATFATITVTGKEDLEDALAGAGFVSALLLVLGIVAATGEYRHGTITSSLLASPVRTRFLSAKVLAYLPHRCGARPGGHARDLCPGGALAVGPGRTPRAPRLLRLRGAGGAGRGARGTLRSARRGRGHADPQPDRRRGGRARLPVHTRPRAVAGVRGRGQVHPRRRHQRPGRQRAGLRARPAPLGPGAGGMDPRLRGGRRCWWTVSATCSRRARRPRDRARRRRAPPARAPRRATPRSGPARVGTRSRDPCCPAAPPPLAPAGSRRCPGRA